MKKKHEITEEIKRFYSTFRSGIKLICFQNDVHDNQGYTYYAISAEHRI